MSLARELVELRASLDAGAEEERVCSYPEMTGRLRARLRIAARTVQRLTLRAALSEANAQLKEGRIAVETKSIRHYSEDICEACAGQGGFGGVGATWEERCESCSSEGVVWRDDCDCAGCSLVAEAVLEDA